jgi:hypothetical protein
MHLQLMRSRGRETETEARLRSQGSGEFSVTGDRRSVDRLSFDYYYWLSTSRKYLAVSLAEGCNQR